MSSNPDDDHTGALMHTYDMTNWWCSDRACIVCHGRPRVDPPDTSWVTFDWVSDGSGPMFALAMSVLMLAMVAVIAVLVLR